MDQVAEVQTSREASGTERIRLRIFVTGIVQGVGFRPFIYRLATREGLSGYVLNNSRGVEIEVEGPLQGVSHFVSSIVQEKPPQSRIDTISAHFTDIKNEERFTIRTSSSLEEKTALISPDIGICTDCLNELMDRADRRYNYPFINCTNCGPRFTIIETVPYDRANTTMKVFEMCPDCQKEYEDPANRRFHAEPNACPVCGPKVRLLTEDGTPVEWGDPVRVTRHLLTRGKIVAIKGLGGFHLAVDASNDEAVKLLRRRKLREEKPLAIMVRDLDVAKSICYLSDKEIEILTSPQKPIVLLKKKDNCWIAESVAPRNRFLGVMLPYTPLHHLLFGDQLQALVMTSGNISEEPIAIDIQDAIKRLKGIADYFLDHNRQILSRCDDSVVRVVDGEVVQIRRSRGWVPLPIEFEGCDQSILCCGAHLKNTIALTRRNEVILSQHIGDLENMAAYEFYRSAIKHLERILEVEPTAVAYDSHPDYLSTRFAQELPLKYKIPVQHHHAHIASCLGEAGVEGPVLGVALDGTGYGEDGTIWGGEILVVKRDGFERVGHLETVRMPGGEKAVHEPWRMAIAWASKLDHDQRLARGIAEWVGVGGDETQVILKMLERGVNSPVTSSCGRLFDAVASLCGIRQRVNYEGQAAIELEMSIDETCEDSYRVVIERADNTLIVGVKQMLEQVVDDIKSNVPARVISAKFHNWVIVSFTVAIETLKERTGITTVALSGGCFQNQYLLCSLKNRLESKGFRVLFNHLVPPNDGGISFGQAIVGAARLRR